MNEKIYLDLTEMRKEALQILIFILYKMTLIYVMELVYFALPCHIILLSWTCSSKDKRVCEQYTLHMKSQLHWSQCQRVQQTASLHSTI